MSHIVFAWEQGQNYGHILRFLPIALALRERGHEVTFCLKDLSRAQSVLSAQGFRYLQAPVWLPASGKLPPPLNYSDVLLGRGFLDPAGVGGLVAAWRSLFELLRPELLVLDHAPSALLASRGLGIPRALIGGGFAAPPPVDPVPPFRWWQPAPTGKLAQSDARVAATVNTVLDELKLPRIRSLGEWFAVEEHFLCTFPELEYYPGRTPAHYRGPLFSLDEGEAPHWPAGEGARIFAYVYPGYEAFRLLLEALKKGSSRTVVYAPGISAAGVREFQSENLVFAAGPVNMAAVQQQADLVVCHAGLGTTAAALLAGKPLLLLPMQVEQSSVARNAVKSGAALAVRLDKTKVNYPNFLKRLLGEPGFKRSAEDFARTHADFSRAAQIAGIADRCEMLIAGGNGVSG